MLYQKGNNVSLVLDISDIGRFSWNSNQNRSENQSKISNRHLVDIRLFAYSTRGRGSS